MNDKLERILEGTVRGIILKHYSDLRLEGLRKTTRRIFEDSRFRRRDLKSGPPEYVAEVLLNHDIRCLLFFNYVMSYTLFSECALYVSVYMMAPWWAPFMRPLRLSRSKDGCVYSAGTTSRDGSTQPGTNDFMRCNVV
jgi:hypothetical protein